jgi:UDP-N-acetylmuramate--alanine ligase
MTLPALKDIKKIYFVGIKGVGVAPLAMIANDAQIEIQGSDTGIEFITDLHLKDKGITIDVGFDVDTISSFFDGVSKEHSLVVTTGAHKGFENPQVVWAKGNGIPILTQGQALSIFMEGSIFDRDFKGVAVAGSHGKTTITALLATTLKAYGLDPSYSIGTGEIFPLGAPGHMGDGEYFVSEADEYASEPVYDRIPKFLYIEPRYAIFNNIDFDHPDLFESIDNVEAAFIQFAENIQSGGKLFINADDKRLLYLKEKVEKDIKIITYGESSSCDYVISQIVTHGLSSRFNVLKKGVEFGHFELSIPGLHNAKNSLAVIAFLSEIGLDADKIRPCLREFKGTKRRSELVGKTQGGAIIMDDYGHHPLEISTTIKSLKEAYAGKNLTVIFQPHTFSRTKALLADFGESFTLADNLILLPIFKSARDTEQDTLSQEEYLGAFSKHKNINFFEKIADMVEYVGQNFASSDNIILTIGAGDVYKAGYLLKE